MKDPDPAVRVHAVDALGNFADRRLLPHLTPLLQDPDDSLVRSTIRAIVAIGAPEAEAALIELLKDPRTSVRKTAAEALGDLVS